MLISLDFHFIHVSIVTVYHIYIIQFSFTGNCWGNGPFSLCWLYEHNSIIFEISSRGWLMSTHVPPFSGQEESFVSFFSTKLNNTWSTTRLRAALKMPYNSNIFLLHFSFFDLFSLHSPFFLFNETNATRKSLRSNSTSSVLPQHNICCRYYACLQIQFSHSSKHSKPFLSSTQLVVAWISFPLHFFFTFNFLFSGFDTFISIHK